MFVANFETLVIRSRVDLSKQCQRSKLQLSLASRMLSTRCLAWSRVITQSPAMIALEPKERAVCVNVAITEAWPMPTHAEYLAHCWAVH